MAILRGFSNTISCRTYLPENHMPKIQMYNYWMEINKTNEYKYFIYNAMDFCECELERKPFISSISWFIRTPVGKASELIYDNCRHEAAKLNRNYFNYKKDGPWFIYLEAHLIEKIRPDLVGDYLSKKIGCGNLKWAIEMLDRFNNLKRTSDEKQMVKESK